MAKRRTLVWGRSVCGKQLGCGDFHARFSRYLVSGYAFYLLRAPPTFVCATPALGRFVACTLILKRRSPFTQDDMSAEYPGGAEAGADRRRTTSPAGASKAQGL
jgi:hypothetical protein